MKRKIVIATLAIVIAWNVAYSSIMDWCDEQKGA